MTFIKKYLKNKPAFFALIRPIEAELFARNLKYLKSPVLDFGCGDGFFAKTVFGKGKVDIGLDLNSNKRTGEAVKNKVYKKIVLYDGGKLPFKDSSFNTIVSNCVLEHIPKIENSLTEIYRVLKPNGYFITSVMTNKWEDFLFGAKIFGNFYRNFMQKKQEHYHLFSAKKWREKFVSSGFKEEIIVGYLDKEISSKIDIFHYLSLPYLISNKFSFFYPQSYFLKVVKQTLKKNISLNSASALFFILKKSGSFEN